MPDADCQRPSSLPDKLHSRLAEVLDRHPPPPTLWVAYSGGLDSTVLLHMSAALAFGSPAQRIQAIHIHHGLHPDADRWTAHCQSTCEALGIPLTVTRVNADKRRGESPEETARIARYEAIEALIRPGDCVLLAQHRDDQAETLMLQLLRGAGLRGLAAMPEQAKFGEGTLLRPFLTLTREDLDAYATRHHLRWVEDSSNQDSAFDRNFLRQQVMPLLRSRWPGLTQTLARTAGHCGEASALLDREAQLLLSGILDPDGMGVSIDRLTTLDASRQKLALREWIRSAGYRMPSTAVIERILREAVAAGQDRNPRLSWRAAEVRRYRGVLYLLPLGVGFDGQSILDWPSGQTWLELPGNGELVMTEANSGGISRKQLENSRVSIRYRAGGETLRLPGREGTHELKKLFQQAGLPPWVRERVPLIYLDDRLASVGGFWISNDFSETSSGLSGIGLRWIAPAGLGPLPFTAACSAVTQGQ